MFPCFPPEPWAGKFLQEIQENGNIFPMKPVYIERKVAPAKRQTGP